MSESQGSTRSGEALVLGTRGSDLALAQARMTLAALEGSMPALEARYEIVQTIGDRRQDLKLSEFHVGEGAIVDKGIFTKELEIALEAREIHAAVHSLKDVPTELADGFRIAAVLPRAPIEDYLITKDAAVSSVNDLPEGAVVATSSVRRQAFLRHLRPDIVVEDIRGNVPTRLRKLAESEQWSGILLARAGLERLGFLGVAPGEALSDAGWGAPLFPVPLDPSSFLPAAGQGAVGIEVYNPEPWVEEALEAIDHRETSLRIRAERWFLHLLGAGCQTPVGTLTSIESGQLTMKAMVFDESRVNENPRRASVSGSAEKPEALAEEAFAILG